MPINWDAPIEIRDGRNGNWFWVDKEIWEDDRLTSSDKVLYGSLAYFANNKNQKLYPSISRLQKSSKLSKMQIYRSIKRLELCSHVLIERQRGKPNQYTLLDNGINHLKSTSNKLLPVKLTSNKEGKVLVTNEETNNNYINNNINPVLVKTGKKCPNKTEGHRGCIEFIESFAKSRGVKFANYGKQINAVHKMLMAGYDWSGINKQIDYMEIDRFWSKQGFDLMNVANEIGKKNLYGTAN